MAQYATNLTTKSSQNKAPLPPLNEPTRAATTTSVTSSDSMDAPTDNVVA